MNTFGLKEAKLISVLTIPDKIIPLQAIKKFDLGVIGYASYSKYGFKFLKAGSTT